MTVKMDKKKNWTKIIKKIYWTKMLIIFFKKRGLILGPIPKISQKNNFKKTGYRNRVQTGNWRVTRTRFSVSVSQNQE